MATEQPGSDNQSASGDPTGTNVGGGQSNPALLEAFKGAKDTTLKFVADNGFDKAKDIPSFLDTVAESYTGLSSKVGQQFSVPKADAPPEEWDKFTAMTRAEKPDAYAFTVPKDIDPSFPYEKESAEQFQQFAFDTGLHPRHASAVHDWYVKQTEQLFKANVAKQNEQISNAHTQLTKEWGKPDTPNYKENTESVRRAIQNLGGKALFDELVELKALTAEGTVLRPNIAKAFATTGGILYKEERNVPNTGGTTGPGGESGGHVSVNPFEKKTENLKLQGEYIRKNPEQAKRLMREAGVDPREFQL